MSDFKVKRLVEVEVLKATTDPKPGGQSWTKVRLKDQYDPELTFWVESERVLSAVEEVFQGHPDDPQFAEPQRRWHTAWEPV